MDQGANIRRTEEMVRRPGRGAYPYRCERAALAELSGDRESASTWGEIALAAVEIRARTDDRNAAASIRRQS